MNKKLQVFKYLIADIAAAGVAWFLFHSFRKLYLEPMKFGHPVPLEFSSNFFSGLIIIMLFWILLYSLSGTYENIYRKSRLKEMGQTLLHTLIGVTVIFFVLLLDDEIASYKMYYLSYFSLFCLHFFFTFLFRFILSSKTAHKIHQRIIGFNTLLVGCNEKALKLYRELESMEQSSGFKFVGFVHINGNELPDNGLKDQLPHLGHFISVREIIRHHRVEEVILALESSEHESINKLLHELHREDVSVKVIPDMFDILSGSVKMTSILGTPLIEITYGMMPSWQQSLKRGMDIVTSFLVMIIFLPLYLCIALGVKLSSPGPVFYTHQRIGRFGKPFPIYKFRSMYVDAEQDGPALSSTDDERITSFGRFLRKTRLDELPQFYNVLIGEMSLVGPRPERQFFIDQIVNEAPQYLYLHKVKPGITSWGQVKYGYAENVEQMIERLKYDIIYMENMSLFIDFKILIHTVLIVLKGKGK